MPLTLEYEPNDICVLRISGTLKRAEFGASQDELARKIDVGANVMLVRHSRKFRRLERGADWNECFS
jgi:hypothetical protein